MDQMQQVISWPWSADKLRRMRQGGSTAAMEASFSVAGRFLPRALVTPTPVDPTKPPQMLIVGQAAPTCLVTLLTLRAGREQMTIPEGSQYLGHWEVFLPSDLLTTGPGGREQRVVETFIIYVYIQSVAHQQTKEGLNE